MVETTATRSGEVGIMATKVQINDEESIEVSSVLTGMVEGFSAPQQYNNVFAVTVTNGGITETFDYHISINDTETGKKMLTDNDHIFAVCCFLWDAIAGDRSFVEFCAEMGYDEDSRDAEKIWHACQEATQKAGNLGIGTLYTISNYIQDKYPGGPGDTPFSGIQQVRSQKKEKKKVKVYHISDGSKNYVKGDIAGKKAKMNKMWITKEELEAVYECLGDEGQDEEYSNRVRDKCFAVLKEVTKRGE